MAAITWYGHAAFKICGGGAEILVDPFFTAASKVSLSAFDEVDLVLVTHDHGDHVGEAVQICRKSGAMLGAVVGTAEKLVQAGVPQKQILNGIGFGIGGSQTCRGVTVTMTQAFHSSDSGVPVGYILKMPDGMVIYHAGDTGIFSDMAVLGQIYGIDVALLPTGGTFTMDALQAAHACRLLGCSYVVPMHYGTFPVLAPDADEFVDKIAEICPSCRCCVMQIGETRDFS